MRIKQFLADRGNPPTFIYVEGDEVDSMSFKEFEEKTGHQLEPWIKKQHKAAIFLSGFDTMFKKGNIGFIDQLSNLLGTYDHASAILCTELNLEQNSLYNKLMIKSPFLQNVLYQPLYTKADSQQFLWYLEEKWNFKFPGGYCEELIKSLGGHFLLLKEAGRLVRDNSSIQLDDIVHAPSMVRKGIAIYEFLTTTDQKSIIDHLKGNKVTALSDYLKFTATIDLPYWKIIQSSILKDKDVSYNLDVHLTANERAVFELLQEFERIVSRDTVAQIIWGNTWEDTYSDWAIDQLIHRLREKITQARLPFELKTKKGEGFILLRK